ncbi:unnamed protein product, partial [Onchocerca flexuosa]|uniref:CC domain-containing protein n=1 Tax=Onchocerca flexuosa TaxID=387005 RepID=A0A183HX26_9BILA
MRFGFYLLATTVLAKHDLADFKCPDDQHTVAVGCSNAEQCIPYTTELVSCIDGACCVRNNPDLPYPTPATCSNGGIVLAVGCTESHQCSPYSEEPVACLQGTCCTSIPSPHVKIWDMELHNVLFAAEFAPPNEQVPQKCPNGGRLVGLQCT